MNLTNFLKQISALTSQCSTEQLIAFIHDIGRGCPGHQREEFLRRLKSVGDQKEKAAGKKKEGFDEMYSSVREGFKRIASQEITLTAILNEEYNDWYDDCGDEFYYEDERGIADILEEACDFVHICMDEERYEEGFAVGKQMLEMKILCENEYEDEDFSLEDVVRHGILDYDLKQFDLDAAYCAYHAVPSDQRPEALYGIINNVQQDDVTLEAVMQYGDEELPEFEEFLPLWIDCLGGKMEHGADRLILEAVGLLDDVSLELQYAEKYVDAHPGLFLNILENDKYMPADQMVSIGLRAMEMIPGKYIVRSRAALKTAEYVIAAGGEKSLLENCYFAACESDTSAPNYLRALLNGCAGGEKREELQKIFADFPVCKNSNPFGLYERGCKSSEREENMPDRNRILLLRFLDGQFADVLDNGLNESEALGWSGSFMKQGIALFLLYMYEGQWNGRGISAMAEMAKSAMGFSAAEYRKGTCGLEAVDDDALFFQLFSQWKSMVQMEADTRSRAIHKITSLLKNRTAGIMQANRRSFYGECASYIAALGEVQESLGEAGAKQALMTSYKDAYPRRNAFRNAMRGYGWIDTKRK